jgi:hypothetical protein
MTRLVTRPQWLLLLCLLASFAAADVELEVNALINDVAVSGCDFQRNGSIHDSADAADHLRLKYSRGKRYVDSAEQFIDRLASESSWTGKPYTVICEGNEQPSGEWLHRRLREQRAQGG